MLDVLDDFLDDLIEGVESEQDRWKKMRVENEAEWKLARENAPDYLFSPYLDIENLRVLLLWTHTPGRVLTYKPHQAEWYASASFKVPRYRLFHSSSDIKVETATSTEANLAVAKVIDKLPAEAKFLHLQNLNPSKEIKYV